MLDESCGRELPGTFINIGSAALLTFAVTCAGIRRPVVELNDGVAVGLGLLGTASTV
jgi:hypothetical protein